MSSVPRQARPAQVSQVPASKLRPLRTIGSFVLSKTLGSGSAGKVKIATHSDTGKQYACKVVSKPLRDSAQTPSAAIVAGPTSNVGDIPGCDRTITATKAEQEDQRIIREIAFCFLLSHPNIVPLHEVMVTQDHYYLFFEHIDGPQMLDFIISHGRLKEKFARRFMRQIVSAVDYCHQNSIVHRDLKIENILIDKNGQIKIIDFGLANLYRPTSLLSTFCGSLYFAAPELLSAKRYVGPEVDVWSMGVILYVLVCGRVPFDDANLPALHAKIKAGVVEYPSHLSDQCVSLLKHMLTLNPAQRATLDEIKTHPWLIKDHDTSPRNHLPARQPITPPFDMEIIEQMRGFQFGTPENIVKTLEDAIMGIMPVKHADSQNPLIANKAVNGPPHAAISMYHLIKERMERTQGVNAGGAFETPATSAVQQPTPPPTSPEDSTSPGKGNYDDRRPGRLQVATNDNSQLHRRARSLVNSSSFARRKPETDSTEPPFMAEPEPFTSIFGTFSKRQMREYAPRKSPSKNMAGDNMKELPAIPVDENPAPSGLLSSTPRTNGSREGASALRSFFESLSLKRTTHNDQQGTNYKPNASDASSYITMSRTQSREQYAAGTQRHPTWDRPRPSNSPVTASHTIPIPKSNQMPSPSPTPNATTPHSQRTIQYDSASLTSKSPTRLLKNSFNAATIFRGFSSSIPNDEDRFQEAGQLDDKIEKIHFFGLFTVQNTSAQHPSIIRRDILRVLQNLAERQSIVYYERKGLITVEFRAANAAVGQGSFFRRRRMENGDSRSDFAGVGYSADAEEPSSPVSSGDYVTYDTYAMDANGATGTSPRSPGGAVLENQHRSAPRPIPTVSRDYNADGTSVDDGYRTPATRYGFIPSPSPQSPSTFGTLSRGAGIRHKSSRGSIGSNQIGRFDITLCKITWRGLYGIQFRRVYGDSWQYKLMCQQILELAHL